ncbi:MAG TPA: DUF58 domain-containing protein [Planctomycetaceae bacterium]|jgi:uncharacterized protein (DUF58 family)|nr:DUF58 domain-containing protein [Planctomycetaceae bacterium]
MSSSDRNRSSGLMLSLPAMLSILTGGGALFVVWKFEFLFVQLSDTERLFLYGGGIAALVWGVTRAFTDIPVVLPRRFRFGLHRVSLPRTGQFYLVIMILIFSGSLLGRSNMLMLVFSMMAGPFVINGWITYSMLKRTAVERIAPPRVMAGEPMTVELILVNRKRLMSCWLMSVRDQIENGEEQLEPSLLFARVPAGERQSGHYQARLNRRGRYQLGPARLTARFPLGIVERGLLFPLPGEILVYPRLGRLSSRWMHEHFLASDLVERREPRQGAFDDEFHRIREYRWGDNPRAIHWRSSARHNALMVREFHQSRDLNLMVLTDLWLPPKVDASDRERLELALCVAATMCVSHMKESRDSTLHVAIAGKRLSRWNGESRMSNVDPLMDLFAMTEGTQHPEVAALLQQSAAKRQHGTRVVLVTTRAPNSPQRRDLDRIAAEHAVHDATGPLEIVEADYDRLGPIFEFV